MEIKRTTEIFVETNKRIIVHQPEADVQSDCPFCAEPMLTAAQIAGVFGISHRAVYKIVENTATHFAETQTGALLVCPNSFAEFLTTNK